ncbi:MAG: J domain-containing protein [Spirochaetales bacterium]|nr:J domain-containing protein [Spirochaetales bacterium]
MRDYYNILGIHENSSLREIKRSFRKKAKELHPDIKNSGNNHSDEAMRILIKAYKVLSDPEKRKEYDRILSQSRPSRFNYREFLKNRKHDLKSQSKLIFFDLLYDHPEEALELYDYLNLIPAYNLKNYLEYGDYLECIFLLAEELEKKGNYRKAFEFLKKIYLYEQECAFFKHYIDEIIERLIGLVCLKIVKKEPPECSIMYIKELLAFNFSQKDNALLYKKLAEVYLNQGEKDRALFFLEKGLELYKKLGGIKKLREKIGCPENISI